MVTAPSEPRADRRVAGRASPFRRYWQAFRVNSSARLTEVGDALEYEWPVFLAWTAGGAVTLVGAIRLLQAWSLESSSAVRNWLGVVPGALLAAGCLGLLLRIYWKIHRDTVVAGSHSGGDARRRRPYVLALLVALVAVVVSVEVFAGLTTLLWKHGRVDAGASEPALWTAERHYLWQLANSVPLLDATRTVGWTNPDVFTDRWSGGLLLLFKLLLVFPSVQIAFAGYRLHQARWVALGAPNKSHRMRPTIATTSDDWFLGAFILVCVGALSAVLVLVIAPTSIADEWAQNHLAGGVGALGVHASLHTLQVIADCLVAGVVVSLFWGLMDGLTCDLLDELANDPGLRFHSLAGIVVSMCAWLLVLPLLVLVGAAVTLALLHAGVAHAHPAMSAPEELEAAATWYAWHFADAIPFFDLPGTLHWSLRHTFADHWSGALLLASKLVFFAVLVVPIARLARLALYRTARSSRASSGRDGCSAPAM